MTLRFATPDDIPQFMEWAVDFFESSGYGEYGDFDPDAMRQTFKNLISDECLITDNEGGMLGFVIYPMYFSSNLLVACELFWYVEPDKRGNGIAQRMLNYFEEVARQRQARAVTMIALDHGDHGPRTAQLYERLGYSLKEQSYIKRL